MNLEKALKTLTSLGLSEVDAKLYVYLSKNGPKEEKELASAQNLTKHKVCLILDSLVNRGIVMVVPERSIYFAVPFEKLLDEYIKTTKEQSETLKASRSTLISLWHSVNEDGLMRKT